MELFSRFPIEQIKRLPISFFLDHDNKGGDLELPFKVSPVLNL